MIIVEGCDGTGKSTLVKSLSEDLGLEIGKRGTDNRDELYKVTVPDTYRALSSSISGPTLLWDRLYFSEFIYAPLMKRKVAFSPLDIHFIEQLLGTIKPVIILCNPPVAVVRANIASSHQMDGVAGNIDRIYKWYDEAFKSQKPMLHKLTRYDYTTHTLDEVKKVVTRYIAKKEERKVGRPYADNPGSV